MTVLEARSVGTPVVLRDSCHIAAELEEQGAVLVTDGTPGGLANAVQKLLDDPEEYAAIRARAFGALASVYSINAVALQLERAY